MNLVSLVWFVGGFESGLWVVLVVLGESSGSGGVSGRFLLILVVILSKLQTCRLHFSLVAAPAPQSEVSGPL